MQTDPIGVDGGINIYTYVGNDPVNAADPIGLDCVADNTCGPRQLDRWMWNCIGSCGTGYWNAGVEGLQTPVDRLIDAGWTPVGNDRWLAPRRGCGSPQGREVLVCGSLRPAINIFYTTAAPDVLDRIAGLIGLHHNYIATPPQFFAHVANGHFGPGQDSSKFRKSFQTPGAIYWLASFAANKGVQRPGQFQNTFTFTARYSGVVGFLRGTGAPTNFVTLVAEFTGYEGIQPQYEAITLYPDEQP